MRHPMFRTGSRVAALCASAIWSGVVAAQGAAAPAGNPWEFKLTPSLYRTTDQASAVDVNLRAGRDDHLVWIGHYQRGGEFTQTRVGYEGAWVWGGLRWVPSIQAATHGFWGGSLNVQAGADLFVLAGLGRTNRRDYYNLNFDPNDAITLGMGARLSARQQITLYTVRDDRLHTGQRITHLVWRWRPQQDLRWTLDLAHKSGAASAGEERVRGNSAAATLDWSDYFVRLAVDRKVNFSTSDQVRMALGLRF